MNRILPALLGALAIAGCGSTQENPAPLTLVNQTPVRLTWFAVVATSLIDPATTLRATDFQGRVVTPGRSASVQDIYGYDAGDDVLLFLYVVSADGQSASYAADTVVSASQITGNRGQVVVRGLQ